MGAAPVLIISKDGETIKSYEIEGEAMLGRSEGCVIRLEDRAISRNHALFKAVAEGVQVERKSEFAPLTINGSDCSQAILKEGDVILIGPYLLKLSMSKTKGEGRAEDSVRPRPVLQMVPPEAASDTHAEGQGETVLQPPAPKLTEMRPEPQAPSSPEMLMEPISQPAMPSDQAVQHPAQDPSVAPGGASAFALADQPVALDPAAGMGLEMPNLDAPVVADAAMVSPLDSTESKQDALQSLDPDSKTSAESPEKLSPRLFFKAGQANQTEFEFKQDEISIGRGKNCDVVLVDKKSSRKNAVISRVGGRYILKDMESANGTYLNGVKVQEQELSGDDVIRIGDTEFKFKLLSADYVANEKDFLVIPPETQSEGSSSGSQASNFDFNLPVEESSRPMDPLPGEERQGSYPPPFRHGESSMGSTGAPGFATSGGITGINQVKGKNGSLIEKFRALPKSRQMIWTAIILGIFYFAFIDEDEVPQKVRKAQKKPGVTAATGQLGPQAFDALTPQQKKFIEAQHALAFDYYKNKDYDKALFEIGKIFTLVNDYKDSREIERYAKEGKRKMEALEEEKRRKDEEARLKAKIAMLEDDARARMAKKQYEQAQELFAQILAIDPENKAVEKWRAELQELEEKKRLTQQQKQIQAELNNQAWVVYRNGVKLKNRGKYHSAISVLQKIKEMGGNDKRPWAYAQTMIRKCRQAIAEKRDPLLKQAKEFETAGDFPKAFQTYKKATVVDPYHPEGYAGMNRIRGILHDRAQVLYAEAILAESYSDFATARKRYVDCMSVAPKDDIYYERAERKLARFFKKEEVQP